jgi:hypothetical protein
MFGGLLKMIYVRYRRQYLPPGPSNMFFQYRVLLRCRPIWGDEACIFTNGCMRWDSGIGASGGQSGCNARVYGVDKLVEVEPAQKGATTRHL